MRKCKCGTDFFQYTKLMNKCCKCMSDDARVKRERKAAKAKKADVTRVKKKLKQLDRQDIRWQHNQTQPIFNKMRRLEEFLWFKTRGLEPECISCGKKNMDWSCGHFKTIGSSGELRYDVTNSFLQCNRYCNRGLSGNINGNKTTRGYLKGLEERFGEDRAREIIEYCEISRVKKWTWQEIEGIRFECNKKIRKLKKLV